MTDDFRQLIVHDIEKVSIRRKNLSVRRKLDDRLRFIDRRNLAGQFLVARASAQHVDQGSSQA